MAGKPIEFEVQAFITLREKTSVIAELYIHRDTGKHYAVIAGYKPGRCDCLDKCDHIGQYKEYEMFVRERDLYYFHKRALLYLKKLVAQGEV